MLQTYEQKSKVKLVTTVIAVLVIAGVVLLADHLKSQDASTNTLSSTTTTTSNNSTDTASTGSTSTATSTGTVKDGTYSATSSYSVPHGTEQIQVSVTLKDGIITDSSIQNSESDFDSRQYQEGFTAEYKVKVVGKKISGLHVGVIAGASDTTEGFNKALSVIASKAEA